MLNSVFHAQYRFSHDEYLVWRFVSFFEKTKKPDSKGTIADVLRPGSEMVAAGYTMWNIVLSFCLEESTNWAM